MYFIRIFLRPVKENDEGRSPLKFLMASTTGGCPQLANAE
jgi:hypothetical protein